MSERKFETIEDEGIIVYDESDDFAPEEDDASEFHLITNEEIFTEEYIQDYSAKMDAKIAKEKRNQRLISVGVVLSIILYIGCLIAIVC